jgi:hypothetical protein
MTISFKFSVNTNSNMEELNFDTKNIFEKLISQEFESGTRCVYVFKDKADAIFFVGIDIFGKDYAANPSPYVKEYISKTLNGEYSVHVVKGNISSHAANSIKERILELYSESLINTVNFHRKFDMEIFENYKLAMENYKSSLDAAIRFEKTDMALAINEYEIAFDSYIQAMNSRNFDGREAYISAHSPPPPSKLAERISFCLKKTKEHNRLINFAERYFLYFKRNERTKGEMSLLNRFLEARNNLSQ